MRVSRTSRRAGFTLVELTLAISLGIVVGAMLLAVVNQQIAFLTIYRKQSFLVDEAPMMNLYFSRMVARADKVELCHLAESVGLSAPGGENANALRMYFRRPDGGWRASVLGFDGEARRLRYYLLDAPDSGAVGEAEWTVARLGAEESEELPVGVEFGLEDGVVRMTLSGPSGERIFYSSYPSYSGDVSL